MSYEPPLEDDIGLDKNTECDDCGNPLSEDTCGQSDRMLGDE